MSNCDDGAVFVSTTGDEQQTSRMQERVRGALDESAGKANDVKLIIERYLNDGGNEISIISQPIVIANNSSQIESHAFQAAATPIQTSSTPVSEFLTPSITNGFLSGPSERLTTSLASNSINGANGAAGQWILMAAAAQTTQGVRQRVSQASDQLGYSLRQLYASASSMTDVPPAYQNIPGVVPFYHGRSSGPPPSYDDVVNPYAPPPTYQSLFGQMLEARKSSRGLVDLLRRLLIISTLGCTMLIAFMVLIPFTMIIVGVIYIDECRVEHIPSFLVVGGLVWASKNIIHCYAQCQIPPEQNIFEVSTSSVGLDQATGDEPNSSSTENANAQHQQQRQQCRRLKSSIFELLLNCILFGWFVAGCVIVFRNYEPDFDDTLSPKYCHRTVYMYTFWLITSAIIMFSLFVGCICCLMVSSVVASHRSDDNIS